MFLFFFTTIIAFICKYIKIKLMENTPLIINVNKTIYKLYKVSDTFTFGFFLSLRYKYVLKKVTDMTTRQTITAHIRDVVFMCSSGFSIGFWQASPARWIFLNCLFIMSIEKKKRLFWNYRTTMKLRSAKCFSAWWTKCWNYEMYTCTFFNTVFPSIYVEYSFHGSRFWIDPRN